MIVVVVVVIVIIIITVIIITIIITVIITTTVMAAVATAWIVTTNIQKLPNALWRCRMSRVESPHLSLHNSACAQ